MTKRKEDGMLFLTTTEVARELGISDEWARQLIDDDKIPATRTQGGMRLVRLADLRAYQREKEKKG